MSTTPVILNFELSLCDKNGPYTETIPAQHGVYYVVAKNTENKLRTLYIGRAENLKDRLSDHEKYPDFVNALKHDEELEIHTATVDSDKFKRVEAALIYKLQPPLNSDLRQAFEYQDTTIVTTESGSLFLFKNEPFTVPRSPLKL